MNGEGVARPSPTTHWHSEKVHLQRRTGRKSLRFQFALTVQRGKGTRCFWLTDPELSKQRKENMMTILQMLLISSAVLAPRAFAQSWEVGAGVGGGFYTAQTV